MKAVLVLDEMPKNCKECRVMENFGFVSDIKCIGRPFVEMFPNERQGRPSWCPLRPLPEEIDQDAIEGDKEYYMAVGYNVCLEKITGETE